MYRANRGVFAELQLLPQLHKLHASCSIQVAQQAEVCLVGYDWWPVAAGGSVPFHRVLNTQQGSDLPAFLEMLG